MIRALVVEDEPAAAKRLVGLLAQFPEVTVIGTAGDVGDAGRLLAAHPLDVVFLDVTLPDGTGFDVVRRIPATTRVVFVTAHADRALDAFDAGAADYLRKPVEPERLAVTIDRLLDRPDGIRPPAAASRTANRSDEAAAGATAATSADPLPLPHVGSRLVETVMASEIAWVAARRNFSRVQLPARQPLLVRRSIADWHALLPADTFARIDRSLIIQPAAIRSTQWRSRNQTLVFFHGIGDPLPLGRAATSRLKRLMPR